MLSKLRERLLLKTTTAQSDVSRAFLDQYLQTPQTFYLGIDPTASFLHLGHFMQIMATKWMLKYGHNGLLVLGEFTASIGDPSGRKTERQGESSSIISTYTSDIHQLLNKIDTNTSKLLNIENQLMILRNTWNDMSVKEFLQVGKHVSLSSMLSKDSVASRLSTTGISYTEFSYMLFQAYDFVYLNQKYKCSIQIGGSDQFGNIITGINLVNSMTATKQNVYGITLNLITDENGDKLGKSLIQHNERGRPVISSNYNDAVYLYKFIINIPSKMKADMIFRLSHLEQSHSLYDLANFIIDSCWMDKDLVSTEIRLLLRCLMDPKSICSSDLLNLIKLDKKYDSFIKVAANGELDCTQYIANAFSLSKSEIKKAIKNKSIKVFDIKNLTEYRLTSRSTVEKSLPIYSVISYGSNMPFVSILK